MNAITNAHIFVWQTTPYARHTTCASIIPFISSLNDQNQISFLKVNGHCSKDKVTSIVYTYNLGKYSVCVTILFVYGVCMFDRIAEHEVAERGVAECDCFFCCFFVFCCCFFFLLLFFTKLLIFLFISF